MIKIDTYYNLEMPEELKTYVMGIIEKAKVTPNSNMDRINHNLIRRINIAYEDCQEFYPKTKVFQLMCSLIIGDYLSVPPIRPDQVNSYLKELLDNEELKNKLKAGNPKSDFFAVMKEVLPYYEKFNKAIKENKSFEVLNAYKELYTFLDYETLLYKPQDKVHELCEKLFDIPINDNKFYFYLMKRKKYDNKRPFNPEEFINRGYYSSSCRTFASTFYAMMLSYYKKTGCIYTPINDKLGFYKFAPVSVVEYQYSDDISLSTRGFKWNKYEFWALLANVPDCKIYADVGSIKKRVDLPGNVIYAPEGFIDESLVLYLMNQLGETEITIDLLDLLSKMGISNEVLTSNKISTTNNEAFYVNPLEVDFLRFRHPDNYKTCEILAAKDKEKRKAYLKKIFSTFKGKHPDFFAVEDDYDFDRLSPREKRKINPKAYQ